MRTQIQEGMLLVGIVSLVATSFLVPAQHRISFQYWNGSVMNEDNLPKPVIADEFGVVVTGIIGSVEISASEIFIEISDIQGGAVSDHLIRLDHDAIVLYDPSGSIKKPNQLEEYIGKRVRFYESGAFFGFPEGFWNGESPVTTKGEFKFYSAFVFLLGSK